MSRKYQQLQDAMTEPERRKRKLALAHTAKKALGLDDDAYRDLLERLTGRRSAKDLDILDLDKVVMELRRMGFEPKPRRKLDEPQHRMIDALWIDLFRMKKVRNDSPQSLDAYCKRMTGIDRLEWLDPERANVVIEGLKAWKNRSG
ncbi:MAG: regulatory protein GemA [Geminicoccaceae bacterium]|nr:regulatory protein GemA [Geminicoccaceae bacterium]